MFGQGAANWPLSFSQRGKRRFTTFIILAKILERWGVLGKIPKLNTIFEESTVYKNNGPFKIATAKEYANYFNIPFWYSRNTNSRKTARILRQAELDATQDKNISANKKEIEKLKK